MTQEIRYILYNKQAHELNKDEVGFINQLLNKKWTGFNFWLVALIGPIIGFVVPLILNYPLAFSFNQFLPLTTGVGAFLGLGLGGMFYMTAPTLKYLGLTRKDWKELKKSGRLKELKQIVKLYNQSNKSYLDDLDERKDEINDELKETEHHRDNLLSQLEELKQRENQVKGEQPVRYTQEYVEELLENEKNMLLKCLERVKEEQKMLQENADSETIRKAGARSERSIDYMEEALEACEQFNEEFDGETFYN